MREELGTFHRSEEQPHELGSDTGAGDMKSDRVYVFQFPPVLPPLCVETEGRTAAGQPEDVQEDVQAATVVTSESALQSGSAGPPDQIKVEDDAAEAEVSTTPSLWPKMPAGRIGKLRVHESGRAILCWGGISFEVGMGMDAYFLQESLFTRVNAGATNAGVVGKSPSDAYSGEAMSFGSVRGKFVVTPDWASLT